MNNMVIKRPNHYVIVLSCPTQIPTTSITTTGHWFNRSVKISTLFFRSNLNHFKIQFFSFHNNNQFIVNNPYTQETFLIYNT